MDIQNAVATGHCLPRQFADSLLVLDRGEGAYVFDAAGKRYLDFGSGIAVNALGYGRHDLADIAAQQMRKLIHTSNLYTTIPTQELGKRLLKSGSFAAVHFGNSGSEANEAALKYARLYALRKKGRGHHKLLCFSHAFHGRTMGSLACTPNEHYQAPFEPLVPGVETIPYNDSAALEKTLDESFAGVIVEAVQGEGGINVMRTEFAERLNSLCGKHDVLLIADEVQTGIGRTGAVFASTRVGLRPDIVTLAKPLAGGLPLSATLIPAKVNDLLQNGDHGTTFGGGPVTTAVAARVWDTITASSFLKDVEEKGSYLKQRLEALKKKYDCIKEVRGLGLLIGIELDLPEGLEGEYMKKALAEAQNQGLLVLRSGTNVIRIAPPLVISKQDIDAGVEILERVLAHLEHVL